MRTCTICGQRCASEATTCAACGTPLLDTRALERLIDERAKAIIAEEKAAAARAEAEEKAAAARAEAERIRREERAAERAKLEERVAVLRRALAHNRSLPHTLAGMRLDSAVHGAVLALVLAVFPLAAVLALGRRHLAAVPSLALFVLISVVLIALVAGFFVGKARWIAKLEERPALEEALVRAEAALAAFDARTHGSNRPYR